MLLCNSKVHIFFLLPSFRYAQPNADFCIKLRMLKGQFPQQMTIAEENNTVESRVFRVKAKLSKV